MSVHPANNKQVVGSHTIHLVQDDTIDAWQALGFLHAGTDKLQRQEELPVIPPSLSRFRWLMVS